MQAAGIEGDYSSTLDLVTRYVALGGPEAHTSTYVPISMRDMLGEEGVKVLESLREKHSSVMDRSLVTQDMKDEVFYASLFSNMPVLASERRTGIECYLE